MKRVLRVSVDDQDCTVEAGLTRVALNDELRHTGLFFPVDPGADATIGGMAATRASGTTRVQSCIVVSVWPARGAASRRF